MSTIQTEKELCSHCGASLTGRWERLTPGLCRSLVKFYQTVAAKRHPVAHLNECGFTTNEDHNFQKLQYFGLIDPTGTRNGCWRLTWHGEQFVRGESTTGRKVLVFRGETQSEADEHVSIGEAMKTEPYWQKLDHYIAQPPRVIEVVQGRLF